MTVAGVWPTSMPSHIRVVSAGVEVTYNWPLREILRSKRQDESSRPVASAVISKAKPYVFRGMLFLLQMAFHIDQFFSAISGGGCPRGQNFFAYQLQLEGRLIPVLQADGPFGEKKRLSLVACRSRSASPRRAAAPA